MRTNPPALSARAHVCPSHHRRARDGISEKQTKRAALWVRAGARCNKNRRAHERKYKHGPAAAAAGCLVETSAGRYFRRGFAVESGGSGALSTKVTHPRDRLCRWCGCLCPPPRAARTAGSPCRGSSSPREVPPRRAPAAALLKQTPSLLFCQKLKTQSAPLCYVQRRISARTRRQRPIKRPRLRAEGRCRGACAVLLTRGRPRAPCEESSVVG